MCRSLIGVAHSGERSLGEVLFAMQPRASRRIDGASFPILRGRSRDVLSESASGRVRTGRERRCAEEGLAAAVGEGGMGACPNATRGYLQHRPRAAARLHGLSRCARSRVRRNRARRCVRRRRASSAASTSRAESATSAAVATERHCPQPQRARDPRRRRRVRRRVHDPGAQPSAGSARLFRIDAAVFAEPVAAACEILEQLGAFEVGPALVLGDGKLGALVAQVLAGCGIRRDGRRPSRRAPRVARAPRHRSGGTRDEARDTTLGRRSDRVRRQGLATAIAATRPRGTLVLKTTIAARHEVDLAPIVVNEIRVLGSRCGPFGPALARLAEGGVHVEELIDGVFPLKRMRARGTSREREGRAQDPRRENATSGLRVQCRATALSRRAARLARSTQRDGRRSLADAHVAR